MHLGPARTSAAPAPDEDVLPRARLHSSSADNRDESLDGCAGRVRSGCLPTARSTTSHFTSTTAPEWRPGGRETCGAAGRLAADRLPVPGKTTPASRKRARDHRAAISTGCRQSATGVHELVRRLPMRRHPDARYWRVTAARAAHCRASSASDRRPIPACSPGAGHITPGQGGGHRQGGHGIKQPHAASDCAYAPSGS